MIMAGQRTGAEALVMERLVLRESPLTYLAAGRATAMYRE
jgi:hypothetical protein